MAANQYVVAWRRASRENAPADWVEQIGAIDGVSMEGSTGHRAQVIADESGLAQIQRNFGSEMLIEPVISHHPTNG